MRDNNIRKYMLEGMVQGKRGWGRPRIQLCHNLIGWTKIGFAACERAAQNRLRWHCIASKQRQRLVLRTHLNWSLRCNLLGTQYITRHWQYKERINSLYHSISPHYLPTLVEVEPLLESSTAHSSLSWMAALNCLRQCQIVLQFESVN